MPSEVLFIDWTTTALQDHLSDEQLTRLIKVGLFPQPITVPVSSRTSQKYFPAHELAARRACLLKTDGDELALKILIQRLHNERARRAEDALSVVISEDDHNE
jgi:hypothetical protein